MGKSPGIGFCMFSVCTSDCTFYCLPEGNECKMSCLKYLVRIEKWKNEERETDVTLESRMGLKWIVE